MKANVSHQLISPVRVDAQTELRPIERPHGHDLFELLDVNREHLLRWHPWVDILRSPSDVEKGIVAWQMLQARRSGIFFGVWFQDRLCGMLNHQHLDWANRWSSLSFWLDEAHQGRGIMTSCCRALITHAFDILELNRVAIECATENDRSRAVPERLGFRLEGVIRGIEVLRGQSIDHAMYGLLRSEWNGLRPKLPMRGTATLAAAFA